MPLSTYVSAFVTRENMFQILYVSSVLHMYTDVVFDMMVTDMN